MNTELMFSSKSDQHETPQDFYDKLNDIFNFTLDPCCTKETAKCEKYFTEKENGLLQDWKGETVFMNPPYGRWIGKWVEKAYFESRQSNTVVVGLLPARTDTKWMHDFVFKINPSLMYTFDHMETFKAIGKSFPSLYFIKGRLKFGNAKNSAPFPSMVVVWK